MSDSQNICEYCGAKIPEGLKCKNKYYELSLYTLVHRDPEFLHQYIVDAYAAQHSAESGKPLGTASALIGLYLFAEKGYSSKQAQKAHMILGNKMKAWPVFPVSKGKAKLTVIDALNAPAGPERDEMIRSWARAVWDMWRLQHGRIEELIEVEGLVLK